MKSEKTRNGNETVTERNYEKVRKYGCSRSRLTEIVMLRAQSL